MPDPVSPQGVYPNEVVQSQTLFEGEWDIGTYTYEVEFEAPDGPPTFEGKHVGCEWSADVRASFSWANDLTHRQVFVLEPQPRSEFVLPPPEDHSDRMRFAREESRGFRISLGVLSIILFGPPLAYLVGLGAEWSTGRKDARQTHTTRSVRARIVGELRPTGEAGTWSGDIEMSRQPWLTTHLDNQGRGLLYEVAFEAISAKKKIKYAKVIRSIEVRGRPTTRR